MPLSHYPGAWRIMMCDFNTGFKVPELVKRRPVITVSRSRNDGQQLCSVVPISSTPPPVVRDFHYQLPQEALPKHIQGRHEQCWIKGDLIQTVAFFRLTLFWNGTGNHGQRNYQTGAIDIAHQIEISKCINRTLLLKVLEE